MSVGKLRITVVEASGQAISQGSGQVHCVIAIGPKKYATAAKRVALIRKHVLWNESFTFDIDNTEEQVFVSCYKSSRVVGKTSILLEHLGINEKREKWYQLTDRSKNPAGGVIKLSLMYSVGGMSSRRNESVVKSPEQSGVTMFAESPSVSSRSTDAANQRFIDYFLLTRLEQVDKKSSSYQKCYLQDDGSKSTMFFRYPAEDRPDLSIPVDNVNLFGFPSTISYADSCKPPQCHHFALTVDTDRVYGSSLVFYRKLSTPLPNGRSYEPCGMIVLSRYPFLDVFSAVLKQLYLMFYRDPEASLPSEYLDPEGRSFLSYVTYLCEEVPLPNSMTKVQFPMVTNPDPTNFEDYNSLTFAKELSPRHAAHPHTTPKKLRKSQTQTPPKTKRLSESSSVSKSVATEVDEESKSEQLPPVPPGRSSASASAKKKTPQSTVHREGSMSQNSDGLSKIETSEGKPNGILGRTGSSDSVATNATSSTATEATLVTVTDQDHDKEVANSPSAPPSNATPDKIKRQTQQDSLDTNVNEGDILRPNSVPPEVLTNSAVTKAVPSRESAATPSLPSQPVSAQSSTRHSLRRMSSHSSSVAFDNPALVDYTSDRDTGTPFNAAGTPVRRPPESKLIELSLSDDFYSFPQLDVNLYEDLFCVLDTHTIVKMFCCILCEMNVIFYSSQCSTLVKVQECLKALLFPFVWAHIYIPLLPKTLLHVIEAPVPFMVGVHRRNMADVHESKQASSSEIVLVDIDASTIEFGKRLPFFPSEKRKNLVKELRSLIRPNVFEADRVLKHKFVPRSEKLQLSLRSSFLRFLASLLGDYRGFLYFANGQTPIFNTTTFLQQHPDSAPFLSRFLQTQMFSHFMQRHLQDPALLQDYVAYLGRAAVSEKRVLTISARPVNLPLDRFRRFFIPNDNPLAREIESCSPQGHAAQRRALPERSDTSPSPAAHAHTPTPESESKANGGSETVNPLDRAQSAPLSPQKQSDTSAVGTLPAIRPSLREKSHIEFSRPPKERRITACVSSIFKSTTAIPIGELTSMADILKILEWREYLVNSVGERLRAPASLGTDQVVRIDRRKSSVEIKKRTESEAQHVGLPSECYDDLAFFLHITIDECSQAATPRDFLVAKKILDFSSTVYREEQRSATSSHASTISSNSSINSLQREYILGILVSHPLLKNMQFWETVFYREVDKSFPDFHTTSEIDIDWCFQRIVRYAYQMVELDRVDIQRISALVERWCKYCRLSEEHTDTLGIMVSNLYKTKKAPQMSTIDQIIAAEQQRDRSRSQQLKRLVDSAPGSPHRSSNTKADALETKKSIAASAHYKPKTPDKRGTFSKRSKKSSSSSKNRRSTLQTAVPSSHGEVNRIETTPVFLDASTHKTGNSKAPRSNPGRRGTDPEGRSPPSTSSSPPSASSPGGTRHKRASSGNMTLPPTTITTNPHTGKSRASRSRSPAPGRLGRLSPSPSPRARSRAQTTQLSVGRAHTDNPSRSPSRSRNSGGYGSRTGSISRKSSLTVSSASKSKSRVSNTATTPRTAKGKTNSRRRSWWNLGGGD